MKGGIPCRRPSPATDAHLAWVEMRAISRWSALMPHTYRTAAHTPGSPLSSAAHVWAAEGWEGRLRGRRELGRG